VCTLATMYWTFWKGAAIMAMVYPLFILVACKSEPLRAYQRGARPARFAPCMATLSDVLVWVVSVPLHGFVRPRGNKV